MLACVSSTVRLRLAAATEGWSVAYAENWEDSLPRMAKADVFVGEFERCRDGLTELACCRDDAWGVPLVLYTRWNVTDLQEFASSSSGGRSCIVPVIAGAHDDAHVFRAILLSAATRGGAARLHEVWAAAAERLPAALQSALHLLVLKPERFAAGGDLAAAAGVSVPTLYRHLAAAGFPSARRLFVAARLYRLAARIFGPRTLSTRTTERRDGTVRRGDSKQLEAVLGAAWWDDARGDLGYVAARLGVWALQPSDSRKPSTLRKANAAEARDASAERDVVDPSTRPSDRITKRAPRAQTTH